MSHGVSHLARASNPRRSESRPAASERSRSLGSRPSACPKRPADGNQRDENCTLSALPSLWGGLRTETKEMTRPLCALPALPSLWCGLRTETKEMKTVLCLLHLHCRLFGAAPYCLRTETKEMTQPLAVCHDIDPTDQMAAPNRWCSRCLIYLHCRLFGCAPPPPTPGLGPELKETVQPCLISLHCHLFGSAPPPPPPPPDSAPNSRANCLYEIRPCAPPVPKCANISSTSCAAAPKRDAAAAASCCLHVIYLVALVAAFHGMESMSTCLNQNPR